METKIDNIFGTFSIVDGRPKVALGPLYLAMKSGSVFIADEFNLAEDSTIQGLAVSLEPSSGSSVLIPGIGDSVQLNPKFMFISCQNDVRTIGRKVLPANIAKRLRFFEYPRPDPDDLIANCKEMAVSELRSAHGRMTIDPVIAERIARFMTELNERELPTLALWSMRDV
jgi:midasin (ATPase involved in ribosome maturation)